MELQYELLTRKGVYSYEYMSSWDRFEDTELPPIESFYSSLNMSKISKSNYKHAQRVWEEFGVRNTVDRYVDKLGNEKEKLIELRFIDSFKFMSSSLDSLTRNLVGSATKLFGFKNYSELQYELLTRKGVYPYEYMTSWDHFEESLPPIEAL